MRLLGPVQAWVGSRGIDLGPRRRRLVLALLALEVNHTVAVDRLVRLAWLGSPPPTAAHAVRVCVSGLRGAFAAAGVAEQVRVVTRGGGYALSMDPERVDAHRFRGLVAQAREEVADGRRLALLDRALALWSGPPLAGTAAPDQLSQALEESRLVALEERYDALLRMGRHGEIVDELTGLVGEHPMRQRLVGQLVLALYRGGQADTALALYRRTRLLFADELGLDPGPELQRIEQVVLRGESGPHTPVGVPRTLPPDVADFTGRPHEMSTLDKLLTESPIVVVSGSAGVGKTSLAVHWAHREVDRFPDGQVYLDLHGFGEGDPLSPEQALGTLLAGLGVARGDLPVEVAARTARLRSLLAGRRMLVLLDNARDARQVRPLLPGTPSTTVVVTSRHDLSGLVARDGARRLQLGVFPPGESVDLLGRLVGDRVDREPAATAALAARCAHLPLAVRIAAELATAYPQRSLESLAGELADVRRGLDLLDAGGDGDTAVRAVFSWSERHLTAAAARLFWLLGLHPGPDIGSAALGALAGIGPRESRRLIDALCRAHLVGRARADRWSMHDLLRAYAHERAADQLGATDRAQAVSRMVDFYLERATAAARAAFHTADGDPAAAKAWLDEERDNLLAVVRSAGPELVGPAVELARTLRQYLEVGYYSTEALDMYRHVLELSTMEGYVPGQAVARYGIGAAVQRMGRFGDAVPEYRAALELFQRTGDQRGQAACHNKLGSVEMRTGRYPEALAHYRESLSVRRAMADPAGEGMALGNIGRVLFIQGRYAEAVTHYEQAAPLHEATGNRVAQGRELNNLGYAHQRQGRYAEALDCHERARRILHDVGDRAAEACALTDLGRIHARQGRPADAFENFERALASYRAIGDRMGEAETLVDLADTHARDGRHADALAHLGRALELAGDLTDRVTTAHALNAMGRSLYALGRAAEAAARHGEALTHATDIGDRYGRGQALHGLGEAADDREQAHGWLTEALEIYTDLAVPEADTVRARLIGL